MKIASPDLVIPYRAACAKVEAAEDARGNEVREKRAEVDAAKKAGKKLIFDVDTVYAKHAPAIEAAEAERDAIVAKMPTIAQAGITRRYGPYGVAVLKANNMIVEVGDRYEDGKRRQAKFVVIEAPTLEKFAQLRDAHYTVSLGELVSDAFMTFDTLKGELEDWHGNLPENLQDADKGQAIQEAIDALENVCGEEEDVDERIADFTAVYLPGDGSSRSCQNAEACSKLRTVAERAREAIKAIQEGELPGSMMEQDCDDAPEIDNAKLIELLDDLADKCDQVVSDAEGIEFPGMY